MKPTIQILPDTLVSQIAAGEVVDRPASIVKELTENSLDAGSTQVFVEIEQGGAKLISVRDNGNGMSAQDAVLACARHATSKIQTVEDLMQLHSFGFRGEALASIASIAQLTLRTRTSHVDTGYEIEIHGGKEISKKSVGCPTGTEIIVRNVFFNTPARKKFLKAEATEASHIASVISHMALANPSVGFELIHNGRKIISVPQSSGSVERLAAILGREFARESVLVLFQTPSIKIHGFIAKPGNVAATKKHQYLFINGRDVSDATIARAVADAYGSRLPGRMYPSFVLHVDIDPSEVDVNVHPRKLTVKFVDQNRVYRDVRQAISQALDQFQNELFAPAEPMQMSSPGFEFNVPGQFDLQQKRTGKLEPTLQTSQTIQGRIHQENSETDEFPFQILGQIADSYILIFKDDGLAIVDQHAAHERILYERFKARQTNATSETQPLLIPLSIECTGPESIFVNDAVSFLRSIGFEIDFWSGNTVAIQACPAEIANENLAKIFKSFLEEMTEDGGKILSERMIKSLACKGAIKFGMKIDGAEQKRLLKDLMKTPNNSTCPHGRPVQVVITFDELERRFYRKK